MKAPSSQPSPPGPTPDHAASPGRLERFGWQVVWSACALVAEGTMLWLLARQGSDPVIHGAMALSAVGAAALLGVIWLQRQTLLELERAHHRAHAAEAQASQARTQLDAALDILPDALAIFDAEHRLVLCNASYRDIYPGTSTGWLPGTRYEDILRQALATGQLPQAAGREEEWLRERIAQHDHVATDVLTELAGDRWARLTKRHTPDGGVISLRTDVTSFVRGQRALEQARQEAQQARQQTQAARQLLDDAIEALPEGFALFDADDRLVVCNTRFRELYPLVAPIIEPGCTFEAMIRRGAELSQYPEAVGREEAWIAERLAQHRAASQAVLQQLPGGRWLQIEERRTPQGGIAGVRADVTELVHKERQLAAANDLLARLSTTDDLTGLANRRRFDEALATEWQRAARQGDCLSLLLVDIDHFKRYNDHYGHLAGDACLRQVADLLGNSVRRAAELVARYGGEEFVVLLPGAGADAEAARAMAERCMARLNEAAIPHANSPTASHLTLSIGSTSLVPDATQRTDDLLRRADAALYRAKEAGRNGYRPG